MRLYFSLPSPFPHERVRALFEAMGKALTGQQGAFAQSSETGDGNPYDGYVQHHTATLTLPGRIIRASDSTIGSTFSTLDLEVTPCTGREWLTLRELLRRQLGAEHDRCLRTYVVNEVVPALSLEGDTTTAIALAHESLAGADSSSAGSAELKAWLAGNEPGGGGAKVQVKEAPAILEGWLQLEREGTPIFEVLARLCPFDLSRWKGAGLTPAPWFAHPTWPYERAPEASGTWRSLARSSLRQAAGLAFSASTAISGWSWSKDWSIVAGEAVPQTEGWNWHASRRARYPEGASLPVVHVSLVGIRKDVQETIVWSWLGGTKTGDVLVIVERKADPAVMQPIGVAYAVVGSSEFSARAHEVMNRLVSGWAEVDARQSLVPWLAPEDLAARVNELESFLQVLRRCAACLVNYDMWDARASSFATPEEAAKMNAEAEQARREDAQATAAIESLIIKTRAEAPAALNAWIDKHDTYLAELIAERVARGEDWSVSNEKEARAGWAELREGKRNVLYWFGSWPSDQERYIRIFGTKP